MTQSPELAGGAGFTFGDQVAARYLASLLAETGGPGIPDRVVCRVALEQRDAGEPLDDIVVDGRAVDGSLARLSLQVKRELTISAAKNNEDFRDIVRDAWSTIDKADFRLGIDRVGAVTGPSSAAKRSRDFQTLAELARASARAADFAQRFEATVSASADHMALLAGLQTITRELGRPSEAADMHRLLRHFVLIRFDTLHDGATDDPMTIALLQQALRADQKDRADDLSQRLQVLARKGAGRARSWTSGTLRLDIAPSFGLATAPSLAPDLERLMAAVRPAAASIADRIGTKTVPRPRVQAMVDAELARHRFVSIRGLPGSGKSALLRERVDAALRQGPALLLKSDRLAGGGWPSFASGLGFRTLDASPLLMEIAATGTPILFIDGLDRIDKAQRNIVVDLISAIEETPELGEWRVLATLRDSGIEPVRTWLPQFFDDGRFASIPVEGFNDAEARELGAARPGLRPLLFGAEPVRSLVRRPFFAKILDGPGTEQGEAPRSEPELLSRWWRRGGFDAEGPDARLRQRVLIRISQLRAQRADGPVPLDDLDGSLLASVDQLVADGVLQDSPNQQSVRFSHDIFFEWSFLQLLVNAGQNWPKLVSDAGEPPYIARAVELHAQNAFVADEGEWGGTLAALADPRLRPQWRRVWLLAPLGHPDFARHAARYDAIVLAPRHDAVRLALVWFQAQHTVPNPRVLDGTLGESLDRDRRLRVADLLGWPDDVSRWRRFLAFLQARIDVLPVHILSHVLTLFEVWQNAAADIPNSVSAMIVGHVSTWLQELERRSAHVAPTERDDRWAEMEGVEEFERALRRLLLRAGRIEQARVADYLASFDEERGMPRDVFEDVIGFAQLLAQTHPRELADFTLRHLMEELPEDHRARRIEEERLEAAAREELRRKPPERRTRLDEMALSSPALGYWGPDHRDWEALALEREAAHYFPPSPLHEPFKSLFEHAPDEALRLVAAMANHATEAWRQLHRMQPGRGTPIPVEVAFPWGRRTFWGGRREYLWSRGLWAPKPLASAFLAMDAWALDQAEAGTEPDALIRRVVDGNDAIAVLGVAVNVALAAGAVSPTTRALVVSQRLWQADVERFAQEASIRSSSQMGFMREDQRESALAVDALNTRPVRQLDLRRLATLHVLRVDQDAAESVRVAIRSFADRPPFEFEEEREDEARRAHYDEQARAHAAWGHLEHYRLIDMPGHPSEQAVVLVNPIAEEPQVRARLQEANEHLTAFRLFHWAERSFEHGQLHEELTLEQASTGARALDSAGLFNGQDDDQRLSMRGGAVAGVAAALIAFTSGAERDWAWAVVERAARMPEAPDIFWTSAAIMTWHPCIFAARAFASELRRRPEDRWIAGALMSLATHPLDCVAFEAARQVVSLWDAAPRLAWGGLRLALDLCIVDPADVKTGLIDDPGFAADSRHAKLSAALGALDGDPTPLPVPPRPWVRVDGPARRRPTRYLRSAHDDWRLADGWWRSDVAAKLLKSVPLRAALADPALGPLFIAHFEAMLDWTIERTAPVWDPDGRSAGDETNCFEWVHGFAEVLGELVGHVDAQRADDAVLRPICGLHDDPCFALLSPLTTTFLCTHVLDAPAASPTLSLVLGRALDRLLVVSELRRGGYRAGELHGTDVSQLAQWLMFVGVERASLAHRFSNGDWSEIALILPTVDRFAREAGWAPLIMSHYLTLVERARDHYPADAFADTMLSVLALSPDPGLGWRGTSIAARVAARVQGYADRDAPLPLQLGQKLLRILDLLVGQGDRRSAALQLSPAFRDLRLSAT